MPYQFMTLLKINFRSKGTNNILKIEIIKNVSNNVTKGTYKE